MHAPGPSRRVDRRLTRRPDQTTVSGYDRDGGKIGPVELTGRQARMVAQLALILAALPDAIEREQRAHDARRSSGDQPEPIRLEVVDYRTKLLHRDGVLNLAVREGRKLLHWSNRITKLDNYRCPDCECVALILDEDEWEVWCGKCGLRWSVDGSQIVAIIEAQNREAG